MPLTACHWYFREDTLVNYPLRRVYIRQRATNLWKSATCFIRANLRGSRCGGRWKIVAGLREPLCGEWKRVEKVVPLSTNGHVSFDALVALKYVFLAHRQWRIFLVGPTNCNLYHWSDIRSSIDLRYKKIGWSWSECQVIRLIYTHNIFLIYSLIYFFIWSRRLNVLTSASYISL